MEHPDVADKSSVAYLRTHKLLACFVLACGTASSPLKQRRLHLNCPHCLPLISAGTFVFEQMMQEIGNGGLRLVYCRVSTYRHHKNIAVM